jgi:hypothetical protein
MRGGFMGDVVEISNTKYATEKDMQKMIQVLEELKELLGNR